MNPFPQVTETELARAQRSDDWAKAFAAEPRGLLARFQKERQVSGGGAGDMQMREGVTLAVRLAELIQTANPERDLRFLAAHV